MTDGAFEMRARVVGIGRATAGDDGVGPAVVEHLRRDDRSGTIDFVVASEPSALVPLLEGAEPVVVVDAVMTQGAPGRVLSLTPEELSNDGAALVSTHGIPVGEAIELARLLAPETVSRRIAIVAVTIERATLGPGLSSEVASAVPAAAAEVLRLVG